MKRLTEATLSRLPNSVERPAYERSSRRVGIVHIGVGAFHKAHQAVYTDKAMSLSDGDWMISGVSLRSAAAIEQLEPQNCLFYATSTDGDNTTRRVIGSIKEMHALSVDPDATIAQLARPEVKVITLTITEKGYCLTGDSALNWENADIVHDLEHPDQPRSAIGYLAAGLCQRASKDAGPVSIISCDNLSGNGKKLKRALSEFLARTDPATFAWIDENASFPCTMVDRIVPAATTADKIEIAQSLGVRDEGCVKTEAFTQWVIEDDFATDIPDWKAAGALIVADVEPFELAKLRLLNGAHSAIAYLGLLAGYEYVHEVMADQQLGSFVRDLMEEEILPFVDPPQGLDLREYAGALRTRFRNPALQHRLDQIAMDGSQKIPQRLLPVLSERSTKGLPSERIVKVIAAWICYMTGMGFGGARPNVLDPLSDRFLEILELSGSLEALVETVLRIEAIFSKELANDRRFLAALSASLTAICSQ